MHAEPAPFINNSWIYPQVSKSSHSPVSELPRTTKNSHDCFSNHNNLPKVSRSCFSHLKNMKIPHCSESRQEECNKMNSLTFVVLFWYIFHIYISYLYMIYIILLLTCSDVSQWKTFKISSLWAVLGGELTFWHWFGMKNGLDNPSFLQNINSTFQPGLGVIIFLLLQVFSLIKKKKKMNVMIYTWVSCIFARLNDGEIASSLLMALVEMLRNELCLIPSFNQESAKIWAEWKQTFPQELHSAPTAWWEPGPTLPPAILPEDVTPVYSKALKGGQS